MAHAQHDDKQFRRGIEQFNSRQFFEAHETWEEIWLHTPEPEKTFLQGIIQVAAAFHHYRRGNRAGTQSLLKAGLRKLDRFPGDYHGLKLETLRAGASRWAAALATGEDPGVAELPQIENSRSNDGAR
jgi:predicted metal-dependent hydrolase